MALVSGQRSALNPYAPPFVPAVYRQVEDFSPEWWELVKNSTWFRDYWLSLNPVVEVEEEEEVVDCGGGGGEVEYLLPESLDLEAEFEEMVKLAEAEEKSGGDLFAVDSSAKIESQPLIGLKIDMKNLLKDLDMPKSPKERALKSPVGPAKYQMKAAQYANPKSAPRRIHQPR